MKSDQPMQAISYHAELGSFGRRVTVSAVFRTSLHVELPGGKVATLTTAPRNGPLTVGVRSAPWDDSWVNQNVEFCYASPRSPMARRKASSAAADHAVDMTEAVAWWPDRRPVDWLPDELQKQSRTLRGLAGRSAILAKDRFGSALRESRAEVRRALCSHDVEGLPIVAGRLIGLGPGLTPAGDDWLCGMALGLYHLSIGHQGPWQSATDLLAGFSEAFERSRTTALSRTFLAYAAQGVADSGLMALVRCMGVPGSDFCQKAREVEGAGHTSGPDMMLGVADAGTFVGETAANGRIGHTSRVAPGCGQAQQTSI